MRSELVRRALVALTHGVVMALNAVGRVGAGRPEQGSSRVVMSGRNTISSRIDERLRVVVLLAAAVVIR